MILEASHRHRIADHRAQKPGPPADAVMTVLRNARRDRGLRLKDVAERLGVTTSTIQNMESGKAEARLWMVFGYAEFVGYRLDLVRVMTR